MAGKPFIGFQTQAQSGQPHEYIELERQRQLDIQSATDSAIQGLADAAAAQTTADTAQTGADTAQTTADTAQTGADTAQTTADNAQAIAELAQSLSETDFAFTKNLLIKNGTSVFTAIDIDADAVVVHDTSNLAARLTSVNLTATITTSGLNGLDTGSETTATWYHIWVIYNGSTTGSLLSISDSAPTLPSGYTFKGYVGAIYNSAAGNFITLRQVGRVAYGAHSQDVINGTSVGVTSFAIRVPTTAKLWVGNIELDLDTNGDCEVHVGAEATNTVRTGAKLINVGVSTMELETQIAMPVFTSQTMYYRLLSGTDTTITTIGWEY